MADRDVDGAVAQAQHDQVCSSKSGPQWESGGPENWFYYVKGFAGADSPVPQQQDWLALDDAARPRPQTRHRTPAPDEWSIRGAPAAGTGRRSPTT
ncbi:hypothetical protein PpBr36_05166 [Pyricularia pennisetigena]|uniref:hypothetical protein n=1 Tax=Pyricularia pennisetigena TaxID=1578925 RepID=UPI001153B938|nr:hypothetical protein PpBr36_05166 [Pyricularia pennisetigena]TLS27513.1 hypothetical protein PpBr36_05166 [Pyricularia pennisetigena]